MDEKLLLEDIKIELEYLKEQRAEFEGDWKDTANYVRASLYNWNVGGKKPGRPDRYTSRPAHYLSTLVSGLLGYTISPNITWLKLSLEQMDWMRYSGVKDWLEQAEKALYAAINRSNLYSEAPIFLRDAATYGHSALLIDEDVGEQRIRYSTRPTPEVYLDVNEFDEVDTVYRLFSMTVRTMISFFGEDNCHSEIKTKFASTGSRNDSITILHAVYPRKEATGESLDIKKSPWASVYVDMDNDHVIEESGYWENPYATFAWERISRTGYGDGPALNALPDILLLNKAEEARIRLAQLSAEPPMNVPSKMKGSENVVPGGFNYYDKADEVLSPINTGMNFPITISVTQDIENRIRDWFHVDFFLMLQQQTQQKTATEVMELQGEKAAVLSSIIVNLNNALASIVRRTFNILYRQGKIPNPPDVLQGSGAQIKIDFVGPLAQAQKKYHQAGGIAQSMALVSPVIQLFPESRDYIDGDRLAVEILDANGFPQSALREDEEVKGIRDARAQMAAQQQQQAIAMQQQQNMMQNYDKLNEPVRQGSALAEVNKQAAGGIQR